MIKEDEEKKETIDMNSSNINWGINSYGKIIVNFLDVQSNPLTNEFIDGSSERADKIFMLRNKKQVDMKLDMLRRKELEDQ